MTQITTRDISTLGIRTRLLEVGPSDSEEAVVFLHGQPGSADDWKDLLPLVAPIGRAVAFDWPGWGAAERPARDSWDFSAGSSANFLAAVLLELGIRKAHLVMHDLGGVGLLWAAAHPDAFASAVLIDTGVLLDFRWHPVARIMRAPVIGDAAIRMATRSSFRAFVRFYNPPPRPIPDEVIERWWAAYDLPTRQAMLGFYRATPEKAMERLVEPLARLDVAALVIWGAHDPAVPVEQAWRQRESFPSAKVVVLDDSGHWPYLDDPDAVADAVVPFLGGRLAR